VKDANRNHGGCSRGDGWRRLLSKEQANAGVIVDGGAQQKKHLTETG